eukprot:3918842-Pleurochrysis_carterae.AAC.1
MMPCAFISGCPSELRKTEARGRFVEKESAAARECVRVSACACVLARERVRVQMRARAGACAEGGYVCLRS